MRCLRSLLFALAAATLIAPQIEAATLYGASASGSNGVLYKLDPATGAGTEIVGQLNDAAGTNYPITGMAFHPVTNALYGSTGNNPAATAALFVSINPQNAQVTVIGPFNAGPVNSSGTPATMADIAFDAAGNLYGVGSIGGPQLYSINIATGQATVIGNSGLTSTSGGGLAVTPDGTFYGTPTASRYGTYDSGTGVYTNITNPAKPGGGGSYAALEYGGGVLYGLNSAPGSPPPTYLVAFDPSTGAVTNLGQSPDSIDAIAWIPEPGTMTLMFPSLALGLLARCGRSYSARNTIPKPPSPI
jgi:hypothetical protein